MKIKIIYMALLMAVSVNIMNINSAAAANPFKDLIDTVKKLDLDNEQKESVDLNKKKEINTAQDGEISGKNVNYAGYSEKFLLTKEKIKKGKINEVYDEREDALKKKNKEPNLLFSLEQGMIGLSKSDRSDSINYFDYSEALINKHKNKGKAFSFLSSVAKEGVKFAGFDEFGHYDGEPYEKILMLNFKSIAYMLEGERKAYNVTRRAINWQNIEKKKFDKKIKEIKEEIKKEEKKQEENGNDVSSMDLFSVIKHQYKESNSKGLKVPSAFVNPFGFYVAGIVQEYDSYEDSSLRDNAKISYKKALELNPKSRVLKQAVREIKEKAPKNKRLVHVVVADGFAPEKKVLRLDYNIAGSLIPVKLPIYEQDKSKVSRVVVLDAQGNKLSTLSQVADIEAIAMRHQYDSLSEQHLRMVGSIVRTVFEGKLFEKAGIFGAIGKAIRDDQVNPDMRSWMSLPKRILASRLYLSNNVRTLQIVSYDKKGNVLGKKKIKLPANEHGFVYARTIDNVMTVNYSEKMWVKAR